MPRVREVTVGYSVSMKVQVTKFELYGEFGLSEERKVDVTDLDQSEIAAYVEETRAEMATRLGEDVVERSIAVVNENKF